MKALVTGVAGFIGSSIAARLLQDGWSVVGIDAITSYYDPDLKISNLNQLRGDFRLVRSDILQADLPNLLDGVDVVYHQAGQPGVRASWGSEFSIYTRQNVDATQALLEAAKNSKRLHRFVYASSSSIYGNAEKYPTTEETTPAPVSPYGVTKLAAEHLTTLYGTNFGVPTVSLRYFTVYGPRQRPDMAFTRFCRAAIERLPISIFGDGGQIRDFTYVDDIVDANLRVALGPDLSPGSVFNVSGGSNVSVNQVLDLLTELADEPLDVSYGQRVPGDVLQTGGSSEALRAATGWEAKTTLRSGLGQQLEWARSCLKQTQ